MKLLCTNSHYANWGLFTTGKEYKILVMSPNKKMVEVINDEGVQTQVVFETSVYGSFKLIGG
ncbi:hypothetical protein [Salmonella phage SSBI34]|nr:hypothetical protein [Salmonella phage SSBI34]